jgi:hypothetical protein
LRLIAGKDEVVPPNFIGLLKPNFLGTSFELYNSGFEETIAK